MSERTNTPLNNDQRYEIQIENHIKQDSYVLYQIILFDLVFQKELKLLMRFKQLKKFHEKLQQLQTKSSIPQFPKTNSFCFWNKTNNSEKKIASRKRQLEYYLQGVFNDPYLRGLKTVKNLMNSQQHKKRSNSTTQRFKNLGKENFNNVNGLQKKRTSLQTFIFN